MANLIKAIEDGMTELLDAEFSDGVTTMKVFTLADGAPYRSVSCNSISDGIDDQDGTITVRMTIDTIQKDRSEAILTANKLRTIFPLYNVEFADCLCVMAKNYPISGPTRMMSGTMPVWHVSVNLKVIVSDIGG